ncbi:MAG: hypothetical protein IH593_09905 [Bacteroidales bacterium]|nr:hypothetical protein [Bacteroidales bacterium]
MKSVASLKLSIKGSAILLTVLLFVSGNSEALSQRSTDDVNISYGIKAWDPVKIKNEERTSSGQEFPVIRFTATNSTYYPFSLQIDFEQFTNLFPKPSVRPFTVMHGPNNLFSFSGHVPGKGYSYRYSYNYWIKPSEEVINENFPYLIPLAEGKRVTAKSNLIGRITDSFMGNKGDTVFCMRRGLVTAMPQQESLEFRLSPHDCFEVLHDDGTYMVYHNLSKHDNMTAPGQIVLPGQPIATISDSCYVSVTLLKVGEEKNLITHRPISYATGAESIVSFEELDGKGLSARPYEVIILEMKGSEIKRAAKEKKK